LAITSDGCVLARHDGDIGYNDFIGARSDLERNWNRLLDVAGLTTDEPSSPSANTANASPHSDNPHNNSPESATVPGFSLPAFHPQCCELPG
jgi:hypothetical protein